MQNPSSIAIKHFHKKLVVKTTDQEGKYPCLKILLNLMDFHQQKYFHMRWLLRYALVSSTENMLN